MSLISNLVVGLSVQTGALQKGFNKAAGLVSGFAKDVAGTVTGVGGMLAGLAGIGSAGAVVALIHSSMQAIDELGKSANKLGVTTDALSALQFAAGQSDVEIETLQGGLQKLNQKLGEASTGSKSAADAFTALGLDAAELSSMGTTEAFTAIADKIAGISDPAQRAAAAVDIFGKSGQELLPLLNQGASGIDALEARAKELGLVLNATDVAKVQAANDAIDELQSAFTGVFNIVAVQVAPIVAHFAKELTNSGTLGQDAAKWIMTGMEWIVTAVAYAIDTVNIFKGIWYSVKAVVGMILTGISAIFTGMIKAVVGGINWLLESIGMSKIEAPFVGVMEDFTRELGNQTGQAIRDAEKAFTAPSAVEGTKKFFADLQAGADKAANSIENKAGKATDVLNESVKKLRDSVADLTADWQTQLDTMGMTSREAEIFKLKQADTTGEMKEQIAELDKLNKKLTEQEELKKLGEEGKALKESLMTPLEKYQAELEKLQKLRDAGAIDQQTFDRGSAKAFGELDGAGAASGPSTKLAGAASANSVEAFSILAQATAAGSVSSDPMDRLAALHEKEFSEAKKQTALLTRLAGNTTPTEAESIF